MSLSRIERLVREEARGAMEGKETGTTIGNEANAELTHDDEQHIRIMKALWVYTYSMAGETKTIEAIAKVIHSDYSFAKMCFDMFWDEGAKYWQRETDKWRETLKREKGIVIPDSSFD